MEIGLTWMLECSRCNTMEFGPRHQERLNFITCVQSFAYCFGVLYVIQNDV